MVLLLCLKVNFIYSFKLDPPLQQQLQYFRHNESYDGFPAKNPLDSPIQTHDLYESPVLSSHMQKPQLNYSENILPQYQQPIIDSRYSNNQYPKMDNNMINYSHSQAIIHQPMMSHTLHQPQIVQNVPNRSHFEPQHHSQAVKRYFYSSFT